MPFDDADIAQMRAYLLKQQEPQQPVYDDGASMLGHDENFMPVGLFGKGPKPTKMAVPEIKPTIDMQRRSLFGLPESPTFQPPAVIPKAQTADLIPKDTVPEVVPQPSSPLTDLANKAINTPMSRRDVLNKAKNAAVSHVVRGAIGDVIPTELPKLPEAPLSQAAENAFTPNSIIDLHLQDFVRGHAADAYRQEPIAVATALWSLMQDTLKSKLSDAQINKYNDLHDEAMYDDRHDEYDSEAAHELYTHMQKHMKDMPPHELLNVLDHLHQYPYDENEVYDMMSEQYANKLPKSPYIESRNKQLGLKPKAKTVESSSFDITPQDFKSYIDNAYKHAKENQSKGNE